ncbi:MAG TPA: ABC transporter permease [Clostridiaceae bacterium]|nr:ABC transporter permease [Clostridiaceae bacterium]
MRVFVVVKNDLKLFFKDWKAVVLFFGLPFAFISLFIYVLSPFLTHNRFIETFSIALVDEENSLESRMLLNQFIESEAIQDLVTIFKADENEAMNMLKDGKVAAVVIIPEGFVKSVSEGENKPFRVIADSRKPLQADIIKNFMQSYADIVSASQNGIMTAYVYYKKAASSEKFYNEKYADVVTKFSLKALSSGRIFEEKKVSYIPDVTQYEYFIAALLVVFIMFSGIMGIKFTANEKQLGIRSRLEISPMSAAEFILARFLTVFIISILQFASIIIPGSIFFNIYLSTSPLLMILLFIIIVFTVSACAVFVATISPSPATADLAGSLGTLLMAVVGGSIYPLTAMPDFIKTLSYFTINRWAVDGFLQIFSANITSVFYWDLAVLAGMGLLYLAVSIPFLKGIKNHRAS